MADPPPMPPITTAKADSSPVTISVPPPPTLTGVVLSPTVVTLQPAQGQADAAVGYADEMLALAGSGGLRQYTASAHRWRGEALLG